jgi:hypothetical protein
MIFIQNKCFILILLKVITGVFSLTFCFEPERRNGTGKKMIGRGFVSLKSEVNDLEKNVVVSSLISVHPFSPPKQIVFF